MPLKSSPRIQGINPISSLNPMFVAAYSGKTFNQPAYPDFLLQLGIDPASLVLPHQVHGNVVRRVTENEENNVIEADGLVTDVRGVTLGIRTADCLPVVMTHEDPAVAAVIHAGWRGLRAGILREALACLSSDWGIGEDQINVFIGPHIRKCCYEVGPEFADYFPGFVSRPSGASKDVLDLTAAALSQLDQLGVSRQAVSDCGLCTSCEDERFFSARRDKTSDRMLTVVQIRPA